jgi:hypothetical protein
MTSRGDEFVAFVEGLRAGVEGGGWCFQGDEVARGIGGSKYSRPP